MKCAGFKFNWIDVSHPRTTHIFPCKLLSYLSTYFRCHESWGIEWLERKLSYILLRCCHHYYTSIYSFSLSSGQFLWAISKLSSFSLSDRFAALPNSLKYELYSSFNATHKFRLPLSLICLLIGNSKDEEFLDAAPLKISPFSPSHRFALSQSLQRNSGPKELSCCSSCECFLQML